MTDNNDKQVSADQSKQIGDMRKKRNNITFALLLGFVVLLFLVTVVRIGGL